MTTHQDTPEKEAGPREYRLRMDQAIPMPLGLEFVVTVDVEGEKFEACVPAKIIYSQDPPTVYGWYTGTQEGVCIIVFPPTSLGTSIWRIPEASLTAITDGD